MIPRLVPYFIGHYPLPAVIFAAMNTTLQFDPATDQLTGPAGSLTIAPEDALSRRFLMLLEGQCLETNIIAVARKYGYCRQRFYQFLEAFQQGGLPALQPKKTGPKSNYRRTDEAVRQVLRHRFLDPEASPEVVAQKLRQTHLALSVRSVQRIIADYGLQKKTLRPQSRQGAGPDSPGRAKHSAAPKTGRRRPAQRRKRGPSTAGR
jgi:winged helix-turn helix protein